jgi:hypothetical protein
METNFIVPLLFCVKHILIICIHFILLIKSRLVGSQWSSPCHSYCMSPTRSGYKELGLELVFLEDKSSCMPKRPLMVEENKDDETRDPFKMLLEESLTQQRNEMMECFPQILR